MADNTTINAGSGGDAIRDLDRAGVKTQIVGLDLAPGGSETLMNGSMPVTNRVAAAATLANVAGSATSVTLIASNANRRGALIFNDSTAVLYVAYAATASATAHIVQIPAGGYWEAPVPVYTGAITGIWSAAAGAARTTELT